MLKNKEYLPLYKALLALKNAEELEMFLTDLCTPSEIQAMADRWRAVKMLDKVYPTEKFTNKAA